MNELSKLTIRCAPKRVGERVRKSCEVEFSEHHYFAACENNLNNVYYSRSRIGL